MTTATMKTAIASAVLGAGLLAGCAPIRLQPWDSTPKKAAKVTANVAIWSVVGPVLAAGAVLYAVGGDSNQAAQSQTSSASLAPPPPQTCSTTCYQVGGTQFVQCDQTCQ